MQIHYDPNEWVTESGYNPCEFHKNRPGANYAGCTCSGSISQVRASDEVIKERRAKYQQEHDAAILREADEIKRDSARFTKACLERSIKDHAGAWRALANT